MFLSSKVLKTLGNETDPIYSSSNKSELRFKSKPREYNRHTNEAEACTNTDCHNICSGVPTVTDDKSLAQVCHYFCVLENTTLTIKLTGPPGVALSETHYQVHHFKLKCAWLG